MASSNVVVDEMFPEEAESSLESSFMDTAEDVVNGSSKTAVEFDSHGVSH